MDKRCVIAREALDWLLLAIPVGESKYGAYRASLAAARDNLDEMVGILRQEEHEQLSLTLNPCPCSTCDVEKRVKREVEDVAIRSIIDDDEELELAEQPAAEAPAANTVVEEEYVNQFVGAGAGAGAAAAEHLAKMASLGAGTESLHELELQRQVAVGHCE